MCSAIYSMAPRKKADTGSPLITSAEVEAILAKPKIAVNEFSWVSQAGYEPASWKWRSAIEMDGRVYADCIVAAQWQQAREDELPKLYMSLVWKGARIYAVDMATQRHLNPEVSGMRYASQLMTADVHVHVWTNSHGHEYVEPLDIEPREEVVFNFFSQSANIQMSGNFGLPELQRGLFF